MTYQDYAFLTQYGLARIDMMGRMLGLRESPGMVRKEAPINR